MNTAVKFQALPPLSPEEYKALEQSVLAHGILVPILVDEDGVVIDGHHRQKIAKHHDLPCPQEVKTGFTDVEKRTLALSLNIDRRHLSREQRRALVAESIKTDPQLSDREHGRRTGVSPQTATKVRHDLESNAQLEHSPERVTADGKPAPGPKPKPPAPPRSGRHAAGGKPRRGPLTDDARRLALDLRRINNRLGKLVTDDRFSANREMIGCGIRPEVAQGLKILDQIDAEINNREPSDTDILRAIAKTVSDAAQFATQIDIANVDKGERVQHVDVIRESVELLAAILDNDEVVE